MINCLKIDYCFYNSVPYIKKNVVLRSLKCAVKASWQTLHYYSELMYSLFRLKTSNTSKTAEHEKVKRFPNVIQNFCSSESLRNEMSQRKEILGKFLTALIGKLHLLINFPPRFSGSNFSSSFEQFFLQFERLST